MTAPTTCAVPKIALDQRAPSRHDQRAPSRHDNARANGHRPAMALPHVVLGAEFLSAGRIGQNAESGDSYHPNRRTERGDDLPS
jgi:hypothetical protein